MSNKKIVAGIVCSILVCGVVAGIVLLPQKEELPVVPVQEPAKEVVKQQPLKQVQPVAKPVEKKYDLYSSTPYDVPLFSVVEISKLSDKARKSVDELLESSQGFYFLKFDKENNKTFVILQNPAQENDVYSYSRHALEFAEISENGDKVFYPAGFTGNDGEISGVLEQKKDDVWKFDETIEPARPLKHIAYDEKGKVKYTEIWNYSENEPVKYEMKNSKNKVISILKETSDTDSSYRKEHIFYDEDGNTKMSVTANYDGANLSRFTYYNSDDMENSISIMSEYSEEGLKSKEYIYNTDYELKNTVISVYENGERKNIQVLDEDGNELAKISS